MLGMNAYFPNQLSQQEFTDMDDRTTGTSAKIIALDPPQPEPSIEIFSIGWNWNGQKVFLESSGNKTVDRCNRRDMRNKLESAYLGQMESGL